MYWPSRTKYILLIILGAAAVGIMGFIIYRLSAPPEEARLGDQKSISGRLPGTTGTPTDEERRESPQTPSEEALTGTPEPKLLQLTDFPIVSPSLNKKEDRLLFYKKDGGDLLAYDFDGKERQKIANITIIGILEALWSPTRERAAVFYLDGETLKGFLHIGTSSVSVLPQNITGFSWSPDGSALLYITESPDGSDLVIADASGRNQRIALETPLRELRPQWITPEIIAVSTAPSGLAEGYLFGFSRNTETLAKIGRGFGLSALFAPDGSKALISSTDAAGKLPEIIVRNSSGEEIWTPGLATLAEKCAWHSKDVAYCAVSRVIPQKSILPDDYLAGALHTADNIVKLDLNKKEAGAVFAEGEFDMTNIIVDENEDYLFFVNRRDGTLWRYKLKE